MKKDIHPQYDFVVFQDSSTGNMHLLRSTVRPRARVKYTDGKEYPLVTMEISSDSHPYYTGERKFVDSAGRVEKFNRKYRKNS